MGGGDAELVLYGDVMQDEPRDWLTGEPTGEQASTTEAINRMMPTLRAADRVTVRINSCGGDLYAGIAIYNAIKSLDADVTVRIEGIAASAASVIACAGDRVVATPRLHLHGPRGRARAHGLLHRGRPPRAHRRHGRGRAGDARRVRREDRQARG